MTITEIKNKVDEFLEIHEAQAKLKREADRLKNEIKTFMEDTDITELEGNIGSVKLQTSTRGLGKYAEYDLGELMSILKGDDLKAVTEIRVNADKVKGLIKLGILEEGQVDAIKYIRRTKEVTSFVVKK